MTSSVGLLNLNDSLNTKSMAAKVKSKNPDVKYNFGDSGICKI